MIKLNIGMIGAGLIAKLHAFSLNEARKVGGMPVVLRKVADLEPRKAEKMVSAFGFESAAADASEIIDDPEINAVYICTQTSAHERLVLDAAKAGKHVFCEKPLAFDAARSKAMLQAVQSAGVTHQVGLVLRTAPVWNILKSLTQNPENGMPIMLVFRDDQCFPIKGAHPSKWRKDVRQAGGGTLIEHSIHDVDLLEYVFGPLKSVRAKTTSKFGHPGIEDLAQVNLNFASGMTGVLVSVWHDVLNRHSNRRLEVFYEKVYFAIESEFSGPIDIMRGDKPMNTMAEKEVSEMFFKDKGYSEPSMRKLASMFGCLQDYLFCKAALEGKPAQPDFSVAVRAHKIIDVCYKSAKEGRAVEVSG